MYNTLPGFMSSAAGAQQRQALAALVRDESFVMVLPESLPGALRSMAANGDEESRVGKHKPLLLRSI